MIAVKVGWGNVGTVFNVAPNLQWLQWLVVESVSCVLAGGFAEIGCKLFQRRVSN